MKFQTAEVKPPAVTGKPVQVQDLDEILGCAGVKPPPLTGKPVQCTIRMEFQARPKSERRRRPTD
jgi:hypothetical protein